MLTAEEAHGFARELTFVPRFADSTEDVSPIELYNYDNPEFYAYPRAWAEDNIEGFEKRYASGLKMEYTQFPDPYHPKVKDPELQAQFMKDVLGACAIYNDFIATAPTGTGKTVVTLNTIARLGTNALVIVPTERLAHQWAQEIQLHLGLRPDQIGKIQGDVCNYKNKHITIAIINSLSMRVYEEELYSYFGMVMVDECHRTGSEVFSQAVPRFNSRWRLGMSATPKRKDGADIVLAAHLGKIRVEAKAKALFCKVFAIPYAAKGRIWGQNHGSIVKCLTLDKTRNAMLVSKIYEAYERNRQILFVSDNILHIQVIIDMLIAKGVPRHIIGQFTGQIYHPGGRKEKVKQTELDRIKAECQIIGATYQMMKEGVDIPRLDWGIDLTPRADAIQLVGRIRRVFAGKPIPEWCTPVDLGSQVLMGYYRKRKKEYHATNMELIECQ